MVSTTRVPSPREPSRADNSVAVSVGVPLVLGIAMRRWWTRSEAGPATCLELRLEERALDPIHLAPPLRSTLFLCTLQDLRRTVDVWLLRCPSPRHVSGSASSSRTSAHEPVFLTKRGQRQAVVISTAEYERLMEADEDAEDLAAADAVMAEIMAGTPTIPWAKVKADLGLA